jgi:hypothetical protein
VEVPVPPDGLAPPEVDVPAEPEELGDPEVPPAEAEAPPDADEDPLELAVVGVVEVVAVVVEAGVAALAAPAIGTVRGGAPVVSAEVEPPPPQADRPTVRTKPAAIVANS